MKPSLTATATVTKTVALSTELKRHYLTVLEHYADLKAQRDTLDREMKSLKESVETILADTGEESLAIDGYKSVMVAPVRKVLDPKRLITLGVDPGVIAQATVEVATTPYLKITVPGAKDE